MLRALVPIDFGFLFCSEASVWFLIASGTLWVYRPAGSDWGGSPILLRLKAFNTIGIRNKQTTPGNILLTLSVYDYCKKRVVQTHRLGALLLVVDTRILCDYFSV